MKATSILQVLLSVALLELAQALPSKDGTITTNVGNALELMGQTEPQACNGKVDLWAQGQPLWGKITLAERLSLFQNVWNSNQLLDQSSNQITCHAFRGTDVSWSVKFDMKSAPGAKNQVKSYTNICWYGNPLRIQDLQVFESSWSWKLLQPSSDLVADISYDIFTAKDGNCKEQTCASTEVMIWLAAIGGALPASLTGAPEPGTLKIKGTGKYTYTFEVWKGMVSNKPVISLVPTNKQRYTSFSMDFKALFQKLEPYGLGQDQYIVNIGAGPEVFQGSGTLVTSNYSLNLRSANGSKKKLLH